MSNSKGPTALIAGGFSLAAICWVIIMFANPSDGVRIAAWTGQALGIGLGSIGLGMRAALLLRK